MCCFNREINGIPEGLHPRSVHSAFGHNTNIWASRDFKDMGGKVRCRLRAVVHFDVSCLLVATLMVVAQRKIGSRGTTKLENFVEDDAFILYNGIYHYVLGGYF